MKLNEFTELLKHATVDGAEKAFIAAGICKDSYSKTDAYHLYGRCNVDRWLSEGILQIINKKLDRLQLEAIAASSNRHTYLPVAER